MSAYSEVRTQFKDPKLLIECLREQGLTVEDHIGNPQALQAYYANETWQHKAEIVIPKASLTRVSNDIGFVKQADGTYGLIVGDMDDKKFDSAWMKRLMNTYSEKGYMAIAKRQGLKFVGKKMKGKKLELHFVKL